MILPPGRPIPPGRGRTPKTSQLAVNKAQLDRVLCSYSRERWKWGRSMSCRILLRVVAIGSFIFLGAASPTQAGPAGGLTAEQQFQTIDAIQLVCSVDQTTLCPADSSDPGYCIPGAQNERVFHPVCNPGITIDPNCTVEPLAADPCVPLVVESIPGCVQGDFTNCARFELDATYVPPSASCNNVPNDPLCVNMEVEVVTRIFANSPFFRNEVFTHPTGFLVDADCKNNSTSLEGVRVGDWFPFRNLACVFDEGLNWDGLILPANTPDTPPDDPSTTGKLSSFEIALTDYAAIRYGLPLDSILPTTMLNFPYARVTGIDLAGATPQFNPGDRYDDMSQFLSRSGTYPLPINFALRLPKTPPVTEQILAGGTGAPVASTTDTVIVGGNEDAYIFERSGSSWGPSIRLTASDGAAGDFFGSSVAIWGDRAVVGAPFKGVGVGAAYVFRKVLGTWIQEAKLLASTSLLGSTLR